MTTDQFNTALARCINAEANKQSPCYPFVGLSGDASAFGAWDNGRQVLLRGVFAEGVTQDAIDRAIALASAEAIEHSDVDVIPCIIAPHGAALFASSEDVLLYYVAIHPDGMLAAIMNIIIKQMCK